MLTSQDFKKHKALYVSLSIVAIILLAILLILITRSYPIALVGSNLVSNRELESRIAVAKRFESNPDKQKIYDQLIIDAKKDQLVEKVDEETELKYFKTGRIEEYNQFLSKYFSGDEKTFVKQVVIPSAKNAILAMKYNSDFGANNDAYNKATRIINRLNSGTGFEELARTESDDKVTGQLGGDLGFVTEGQLLPELEQAVKSSTLGEVKKQIVVSRVGYHILYPVETASKDGQKVWHVKHILVTTSGYDSWLQRQLDTVSVRRLFNI